MENTEGLSLEQIRAFLQASQEVHLEATEREEVYGWVTRMLCQQQYWKQKREAKGLLRRYLATMTGLSRGASDPVDRPLPERGAGAGAELSAEPVRKTLHRG